MFEPSGDDDLAAVQRFRPFDDLPDGQRPLSRSGYASDKRQDREAAEHAD